MNTLLDFLHQVFAGVGMTEEQEKAMGGICAVCLCRAMLETLMGLNLDNREFYARLNNFFESEIQRLTEEQKKQLDNIMAQERERIVVDALKNFGKELPPDLLKKMEDNLHRLSAETKSQ
jgi:succinate dehydrogenase flavin-adding protein (antitoxin of CptAB toxin-antitoxin module)